MICYRGRFRIRSFHSRSRAAIEGKPRNPTQAVVPNPIFSVPAGGLKIGGTDQLVLGSPDIFAHVNCKDCANPGGEPLIYKQYSRDQRTVRLKRLNNKDLSYT